MTLDLAHLQVEIEFGVLRSVDCHKDVANAIHRGTADIGVDDLARKLYYTVGEVEIPQHMIKEITHIVRTDRLLVAYVKRAVLDNLKETEK